MSLKSLLFLIAACTVFHFPALLSEKGKYLPENFRIRVVPSLSTLKLIQDSPADYHSQTDALVVGDPDVGTKVIYRGSDQERLLPIAWR